MKANLAEAHDRLLKAIGMANRAVEALNDGGADNLMIAAAASQSARDNISNASFAIRKELDNNIENQPNTRAASRGHLAQS